MSAIACTSRKEISMTARKTYTRSTPATRKPAAAKPGRKLSPTPTTYALNKASEHGKVVKYANADGVNFYCPKDALPEKFPSVIILTVDVP